LCCSRKPKKGIQKGFKRLFSKNGVVETRKFQELSEFKQDCSAQETALPANK